MGVTFARRPVWLILYARLKFTSMFPIIVHSLPEFVLAELAIEFANFERESLPAGFHERLKSLSARLLSRYPSKPAADGGVPTDFTGTGQPPSSS